MNVIKLSIERPVDPAETWGAGYKVDLLAGPDANFLSTQSTLSTGKSDLGVKQAYLSALPGPAPPESKLLHEDFHFLRRPLLIVLQFHSI